MPLSNGRLRKVLIGCAIASAAANLREGRVRANAASSVRRQGIRRMMTHCADPYQRHRTLDGGAERMRNWAVFYDHLRHRSRARTARKPQIGTYTPVLAVMDRDLAASVADHPRDSCGRGKIAAIADASPALVVEVNATDGYFELEDAPAGPAPAAQRPRLNCRTAHATATFCFVAACSRLYSRR